MTFISAFANSDIISIMCEGLVSSNGEPIDENYCKIHLFGRNAIGFLGSRSRSILIIQNIWKDYERMMTANVTEAYDYILDKVTEVNQMYPVEALGQETSFLLCGKDENGNNTIRFYDRELEGEGFSPLPLPSKAIFFYLPYDHNGAGGVDTRIFEFYDEFSSMEQNESVVFQNTQEKIIDHLATRFKWIGRNKYLVQF